MSEDNEIKALRSQAGLQEPAADESPETNDTPLEAPVRRPLNRGLIVMLALLVIGAGGIGLMRMRLGPQVAKADAQSVVAQQTISQFLSGGDKNIKAMRDLLQNTEKLVARFAAFPSAAQVPLSDLKTNPFREGPATTGEPRPDDGAALKKQEEERLAILKSVQSFQLQSVIYGDARKACMINESLYREGQAIDTTGFIVERVNPNSVVVKNGVYRFELAMTH